MDDESKTFSAMELNEPSYMMTDDDTSQPISSSLSSAKKSRKKFKDFSLNTKELFTTVTEKELEEAFKIKGLTKMKSKKVAVVDQKDDDDDGFEIVGVKNKMEITSPFVAAAIQNSQMTRTENNAPTYSTSGDERVDFFFHVMEQTDSIQTKSFLEKSWNRYPLHTLKLVALLRDIRGGKGIRRQYHECLYWLYENHPKTLYENLEELLKFGYWKDCLQMLMVIICNGYVHPYLARDDVGGATQGDKLRRGRGNKRKRNSSSKNIAHFQDSEIYNGIVAEHFNLSKNVCYQKGKMDELRLKFAREKFATNVKYRVFHVRIAQIFAKQLQKDLVVMKSDAVKKDKNTTISLAAKWAPSLEAHFDRYTLISSTVALELVKLLGESKFEVLTKSIPVAVYLSRKCYHKEYCVPLRKFLEVAEVSMSAGLWHLVNYARVPSKCMKRNSKLFKKHDEQRFTEYLENPDAKVAGATLKPIEILTSAMTQFSAGSFTSEVDRIVLEKQWLSLVEDVKKKGGGLMKNAVAVCDVSGSMSGDPMLAALGLTLITMEMCEKPWNSICITFHESPTFHHLPADGTLLQKVQSLQAMEWGMNTNIQKMFELVLDLGLKNKLTGDQMPKILLIFTDMEFDYAFPGTNLTNFTYAKDMFHKCGYKLPAIVFWNLRAKLSKTSTPVQVNEFGAILLSGFSAQQLAYVMNQEDLSKCTPLQFVLDIIERDTYKNLVVHD